MPSPAGKSFANLPRLKSLLKSIYYGVQRLPPINYSQIDKDLIRRCVGREDPTILDIGCNDGSATLSFLGMFENPRIFCFEPDPRAIARFKASVGSLPNVHLFEIALGSGTGPADFYPSNGSAPEAVANQVGERKQGLDLSGSIRKPKEHLTAHPWVTFDDKTTVEASTLDDWREKHGVGTIDFVWMDVQGAETDVFEGGRKALARTRYVYTEYSNRELYEGQANLRKLMRQLAAFKVLVRYRGDVLFENKLLARESR